MNRLILKMPKFVIEKYINEHFDEITEEEFFELLNIGVTIPWFVYTKNKELRQSKKVLKEVITKSPLSIKFFDPTIFDEEILNQLSVPELFIDKDFVIANLQFLKNVRFCEKVIAIYPEIINYLTNDEITPNIINILEDEEYVLTKEDIRKRSSLLNSKIILENSLIASPQLSDFIKRCEPEILMKAINNGFNIDYNDLVNNSALRTTPFFINFVYKNDVRAIRFFTNEMLQYDICYDAIKRGYVPTEADILFNPVLRDRAPIMELAINNDPKLIKYITDFCGIQLNLNTVKKALDSYKITERDLCSNPDLCHIYSIMTHYPEYRLYSTFISEEEKVDAVKDILIQREFDKLIDLPFFKAEFNSNFNGEIVTRLAEVLSVNIMKEEFVDSKKYYEILDYIIDGIVTMRYRNDKLSFIFPDVATLDSYVMNVFLEIRNTGSLEKLDELAVTLYKFVNMNSNSKIFMNLDYIKLRIEDLYTQYKADAWISRNITTVFYNEILNKHRNCYYSNKKAEIINEIKTKLDLTDKKKNSIYNGRKLARITELFARKDYETLETTESDIKKAISYVENELKNNKDLVKLNIIIDDQGLLQLRDCFINNGKLDYKTIAKVVNTDNSEVIQFIFRKYEQIKLRFLNKISLSKEELIVDDSIKANIGFNHNYFSPISKDKYFENIAILLLNTSNRIAQDIILNARNMPEIVDIIPFSNLLPELSFETISLILAHYNRIKGRMNMSVDECLDDINTSILARFTDVIALANGYGSINDFNTIILGKDVVNKIGVRDIEEYFEFYKLMYKKIEGAIPKVQGEMGNITYESGNYDSPERLLIGKNCNYICVDLTNFAGKKTYEECLAEKSGDVIIMHSKDDPNYYARILMFRRGNVVQLSSIYDNSGKQLRLDDVVFENIAKEILTQSEYMSDNIDFVFVNTCAISKDSKIQKYTDNRFISKFPHADFENSAHLVGLSSRMKEKDVLSSLEFDVIPKALYKRQRRPITNSATEDELTRIKALKIVMEENSANDFEPFYRKAYVEVISGEDWYVAIKENGEYDTVLLSNDQRARIEFEEAINLLQNSKIKATR